MGQAINELRIDLLEKTELINVNQIAKDLDTMRKRLRKLRHWAEQTHISADYVREYQGLIEKQVERFKRNKSNEFDGKEKLVEIMEKFVEEAEGSEYDLYIVPLADDANVALYNTFKELVEDGKLDY